jgi:hypothetical protein
MLIAECEEAGEAICQFEVFVGLTQRFCWAGAGEGRFRS